MRRLIAIVLMLLLPIQSAWALVAVPCHGQVDVQLAQAAHPGHHGDGMEHALHADMADMADVAGHHDSYSGHDGHHAAPQPAELPAGDAPAAPTDDPCSGSAACMSLHSPPLAAGFDAGLPTLQLPHVLRPAQGSAFSSVPPAREQRPPIGLPA